MCAKSSSRNAVDSVARAAAMASALPVRVPPTPEVSIVSCFTGLSSAAATWAVMPYAAIGTPPPMVLPTVTKSGSRPHAAVAPPGPTQMVWVSSITSSVPAARVRRRTASR